VAHERILLIEDDPDIAALVQTYLGRENFRLEMGASVEQARKLLASQAYDLLLLDIGLPDGDGLTLCRELRKTNTLPVLMLSARGDEIDRILGLEVGADDYLCKPFHPKELVARVRALLRRSQEYSQQRPSLTLSSQRLRLEVESRRCYIDDKEIALTPIEFSLLKAFLECQGRVLSRQELLNRCWGVDFFGDERTVDAHLRNLRAKLRQQDPSFARIQACWGQGYRFD